MYNLDMKLPDTAQELIAEANIKPDFIYKEKKIAIFCDGSVHDSIEKRQQDNLERDDLKYQTTYQVVTLRHDDNWQAQLITLAGLV